ncbi:hypothetical protein EJ05DRAFT_474083 [Pseudovirgaria hyperparasitica]|uniref:Uncharacterized protein n=1 Tax=Pseudovirgaria hyperparasitica TaxID=470096 RepID=A0A6A6WBG9_9PEZI|nr:uncharacterized protein EJ05DRAFT_474083 [Pseudovirgaria hyperparasitica]KAF2760182.1 hypothetical protein EJ05DRAFT_474083 [Pseudovirgaria hyperparasitica]
MQPNLPLHAAPGPRTVYDPTTTTTPRASFTTKTTPIKPSRTLTPPYPPKLPSHILTHHDQTGGNFQCILALTTSNSSSSSTHLLAILAAHFDRAIHLSTSTSTTTTHQPPSIPRGRTNSGRAIESLHHHHQHNNTPSSTSARILDLGAESVDLIVVHDDGDEFSHTDTDIASAPWWRAISRVLRTSGTVAIWRVDRAYCYPLPTTTVRCEEVQRLLFRLEDLRRGVWDSSSGNDGSGSNASGGHRDRDRYTGIPMPWQYAGLETPFDKYAMQRMVWNARGEADALGEYFAGIESRRLDEWEHLLRTTIATKTTTKSDNDSNTAHVIASTFAQLRDVLGEGVEEISMVGPTALVTMKKIWWYTTRLY